MNRVSSYDATSPTCPLGTPYSPYAHPQVRHVDLIYHCQTVFSFYINKSTDQNVKIRPYLRSKGTCMMVVVSHKVLTFHTIWVLEGIEGKYMLVSVLTQLMQYLTGRSSRPFAFALGVQGNPKYLRLGFFALRSSPHCTVIDDIIIRLGSSSWSSLTSLE